MGEAMSRKRPSGSGPEAVRTSPEEQRQGGSRTRPQSAEKSTGAPGLSGHGGEWHPRWRKSHRKEEGFLQQNRMWGNVNPARASEMSPAAYVDAGEPTRNLLERKEAQMDLCKEILIESKPRRLTQFLERPPNSPLNGPGSPEHAKGDAPPPAKSGSPHAKKRPEWSSLDVCHESRAPDGTQFLSRGTQTEAAYTDHEDQASFQSGRDGDSTYMLKLAESSEKVIQQGLKEFFGFLRILVNIPTLFMLELIRFLGKSIFQVLVVGLLTAIGEQMLEPFLAAFFNSILHPLLSFLLNVLCSIRNLSYPIIEILKGICLQVAVMLRAFRLIEINNHSKNTVAEQV